MVREFKQNWFEPVELGEYVSALSNAAALQGQQYGYFIWGIDDKTHKVVGTEFNQYKNYKNEPYQNFLARDLSPKINFKFYEETIDDKRVVILQIPAAFDVPTSFNERRFFRIGSSKANLKDYPKKEKELFKILETGIETIQSKTSEYQNLSFNKLFGYYGSKGIVLNKETFIQNLGLKNIDDKFNLLAQLLSDDSHFSIRVTIFSGKDKSSSTISNTEFGNNCLLYSLDDLLRYGSVLNIIQADEAERVVERKEIQLYDESAYREAIINAILHNRWVDGNEPMISVFSNRIEILSRGSLPYKQTPEGFFSGVSVPVNPKLSEIFFTVTH